jgi:hypothetical protein
MYQAEVSTPESRGFMVSMHGIMFAMGYSLSAWIGMHHHIHSLRPEINSKLQASVVSS